MSARRPVLALLAALLCAPPGWAAPTELVAVSTPPLEAMDRAVREQLEEARSAVDELLRQGAAPDVLAGAYGELGQLYLAYQQMLPAEQCFVNASRLDPDDYKWHYYLGYVRKVEGDLEGAEEAFVRVLRLRPGDLVAWLRLAETLQALGRFEEAEGIFARVLKAAPGSAAARYGLGSIASARGELDRAAEHYEAALAAQPEASAIHYQLGLVYRDLGRPDEAKRHLERAGPGQVEVADGLLRLVRTLQVGAGIHYVRGTRALRQGRLEEALAEYRLAVEANPGSANVRRALGLALLELGRFEEAASVYAEAVRLDPGDALSFKDLGVALARAGRPAEASEAFAAAVEIDPELKEALLGLGVTLARQGEALRALPHLDRVVEIAPEDRSGHLERGLALAGLKRFPEAIEEFRWLLERDPEDAAARLNLASSLLRHGDADTAESELRRLLEGEAPAGVRARALLLLGNLEAAGGDRESAVERFREALGLDASLVPARFRLGMELLTAGRFEAAAVELAAVVEAVPGHGPARFGEAAALMEAGRHGEALERLEEGRQALPRDPGLARLTALLLAAAPEPELRAAERSLALARQLFALRPTALHGEILALALAAAGRFEDAAARQRAAAEELERTGLAARAEPARRRLDLYRRGEPCRAPWSPASDCGGPGLLEPAWPR